MPPKDKYSDPKLRDEVKEEIHNSDKGGAPGQWSARKAQMMAAEYKKRGGDYNTDKSQQDESQKNLSKWGEEEWQTKEGSGNAKQEDGTEKRYLPKKAWENMTEEEKEATEEKKQEGSKEGKQFVGNTEKAKDSRQKANDEESEEYDRKKENEKQQKQKQKKAGDDKDDGVENDEEGEDSEAEYQDDGEAEGGEEDGEEGGDDAKAGQKRTRGQQGGSKKSQKSNLGKGNSKSNGTVGSKHMDAEEPGPRGSADRLPKNGQQVHWKAMPGYVDGEVVEVLTEGKKVDGKDQKASKDDPKVVLKSNKSGKICVHKPDACFYE